MKRQIFGIGETVLDVVFKNDTPLAAVPGGSTFNSIISLGRSVGITRPDIPIRMITETGDDHIGDIVMRFLKKNNISTDCVTRNKGTQTHISMAFLDDRNDAMYEFYKDHEHASLSPERFENIDFRADDLLLTGSFFSINPVIRNFTSRLYQAAHNADAIIYYDVNFRRPHLKDLPVVMDNIIENFRFADIVRGSTDDFEILFGTSDPREIYERHIKEHCDIFICTDGSRPVNIFTPQFTAVYPLAPVKTVSTIGAGDNFNAGIICSIVDNDITKQELRNASKQLWDSLISKGIEFSAEVCGSLFNYIEVKTQNN